MNVKASGILEKLFLCCLLYIQVFFSGNARKMHEGIVSKSMVYFANTVPSGGASVGPEPLKLKKIVDMVGDCLNCLEKFWLNENIIGQSSQTCQ